MTWRDIKRQARATVHNVMALPCFYLSFNGDAPQVARARLHTHTPSTESFGLGNLLGQGYATREEDEIRLVVESSEIQSIRGDIFIFNAVEGYCVQTVRPSDDITITLIVTRLSEAEVSTYTDNWGLDYTLLI